MRSYALATVPASAKKKDTNYSENHLDLIWITRQQQTFKDQHASTIRNQTITLHFTKTETYKKRNILNKRNEIINKKEYWAIVIKSQSIAKPPSRLRPSVGCLVNNTRGPLARACILSRTWRIHKRFTYSPTNQEYQARRKMLQQAPSRLERSRSRKKKECIFKFLKSFLKFLNNVQALLSADALKTKINITQK